MSTGDVRKLERGRPVLVRAPDGGVWTGSLRAWERIDGVWHGHAVWNGYTESFGAVVPADRLRPFQWRWCEAREGAVLGYEGEWYPGRMIGVRQRPGSLWEGLVEPANSSSVPAWLPMHAIRLLEYAPTSIGGGDTPF